MAFTFIYVYNICAVELRITFLLNCMLIRFKSINTFFVYSSRCNYPSDINDQLFFLYNYPWNI